MSNNERRSRCIIAADVPTLADAEALLARTGEYFDWYKIGMQLFYAEHAAIVEIFKRAGKRIFLDLKLHDIPATVGKAASSLVGLAPDILTVHASGGRAMIEAAVEALPDTRIVGVTVLTSLDDNVAQAIYGESAHNSALRLMTQARDAGAAGVVCSPHEANAMQKAWPAATIITPGIRFTDSATNDQARIATPRWALDQGASYLVVGRAVTAAGDVGAAVTQLDADLNAA